MQRGFKYFYYTYLFGTIGVIIIAILLPYLDKQYQHDLIGIFTKYKLDKGYLSKLEVEVYKGKIPSKYIHILSEKTDREVEFIQKSSISNYLDKRLGIVDLIAKYNVNLRELLSNVTVTEYGSNINSESERFAKEYVNTVDRNASILEAKTEIKEIIHYHLKFRPILISRASRLFKVVDFSYKNILFISLLHMMALILLGWLAVPDDLKRSAGGRIQTAGYLHTLIGFSAAILQLSADENMSISAVIPYLGSALITSILGWFLGGEIEELGEEIAPQRKTRPRKKAAA